MNGEADDVTWAYAWPAGVRLCADLSEIVDCRNKSVADLGCGLGACGSKALEIGARSVLFADGNEQAVARLAEEIAKKGQNDRAKAIVHQWGEPLPERPFDLILGGDILYRPEYFERLLRTIELSLAIHGEALLTDPRMTLEADIATIADALGLTLQSERRAGGYTLLRVRRG